LLKLHQLFFINFLLIFIATLLTSGLVSYFTLKEAELKQFENHLKNTLNIVEIELEHIDDFEKFANSFYEKSFILKRISFHNRITIIDKNGNVVADSDLKAKDMENHLDRKEIIEADSKDYGVSLRFSESTKKNYLYVAKRVLTEKEPLYIRLAVDTKSIMENFYKLWIKVTLIFTLSIFIALIITYMIQKNIKYDINRIKDFLEHINNKNFTPDMSDSFTEEFDFILKNLKKLSKKLEKREKQKKKFTKKLIIRDKQNREIISAISHEFKNPLAVILGYCETLVNDRDINPKIRDKFLDKISLNAHRIGSIIDRVNMAIKLENGDFKLKLTSFDIEELSLSIISMLKDKYNDREILLEIVDRTENNKRIEADKTLIELVLINLIENALKYSEDDVKVEIAKDEIRVIDSGIGIDIEDIEEVTKKFYRVDKNIWNNSLGLGLNIVKYILKLHNTKLDITSEITKGSTFSFKL